MTLGAAAEILVKDTRVLEQPVLHQVPTAAMKQRWRLELSLRGRRWSVVRAEPVRGAP